MFNLNETSKKAHEMSIAKGWYEGRQRTTGELIQLMISEISEATEEVRSGHPLLWQLSQDGSERISLGDSRWDSSKKPEGELVELADCLIRIGDACHPRGIDLNVGYEAASARAFKMKIEEDFRIAEPLEQHLIINVALIQAAEFLDKEDFVLAGEAFGAAVWLIDLIFSLRGAAAPQDLESVTSLKMQYNSTRPHRHGGKLV